MDEVIRAILRADAGVTALVGQRINFGSRPQGEPLPALALSVPSDIEAATLDGASGLNDARIQVNCAAMSYGEARRLERAVRSALHGYSGGILQGVFHAGSRDFREGGTNEAERLFGFSVDFSISYNS